MRMSLLLLLMAYPASVFAQSSDSHRPPVELGAGFMSVGVVIGDGAELFSAMYPEIRITVPSTPRFAFEAILVARGGGARDASPFGLYFLQVKQLPKGPHRPFRPFMTYGLAGTFHQTGSGVRRHAEVIPPILTAVGFGLEYEVGPRAALRMDVQGVTLLHHLVGARLSIGASIPLSGYR